MKHKNPLRPLTKRRDFEMVLKEGVAFGSRYITLYARPNELNFSRIGLSVSKKVGTSVTRNRLKRLLREAMRRLLHELHLNYDFVIVARSSSVECGLDDFIQDIKRFFLRLIHEKGFYTVNKAI